MNKQQFNDELERIVATHGLNLLEILDEVKNQIADARVGDYSVEARKCAIASIDERLYNIVKQMLKKENKIVTESFNEGMI